MSMRPEVEESMRRYEAIFKVATTPGWPVPDGPPTQSACTMLALGAAMAAEMQICESEALRVVIDCFEEPNHPFRQLVRLMMATSVVDGIFRRAAAAKAGQ